MRVVALALVAGCSFSAPSQPTDGGSGDSSPVHDVSPIPDGPIALSVAHVPAAVTNAFDATADLALSDASLDTGSGTDAPLISITLPTGASLITSSQDGGGPDLVILEVGSLTITGTLTVTGGRPLVVIARSTVSVSGAIEASAVQSTPGPAGYGPGLGSGAGGAGADDPTSYDDSGGGGGGYGTAASAGQASGPAASGTAGALTGTTDLAMLDGGSGGGTLSPVCSMTLAGAGGGAIELYAGEMITITGAVRANGGGGAGGTFCNVGLAGSGAGGGAGGAIYLQSQQVTGGGLLLAQGGGGGGGSTFSSTMNGGNGGDGMKTIAAAAGGTGPGTGVSGETNVGATGGFRDAMPQVLTALSGANYGNGGGGGGSVGRIVIRASGSISSSPTAVVVAR